MLNMRHGYRKAVTFSMTVIISKSFFDIKLKIQIRYSFLLALSQICCGWKYLEQKTTKVPTKRMKTN